MRTPCEGASDDERAADDQSAANLLSLVHYLKEGKGLCCIASILSPRPNADGTTASMLRAERAAAKDRLRRIANDQEVTHFVDVAHMHSSFRESLEVMISCTGLGNVRPNTVVLGYSPPSAQGPQTDAEVGLAAETFDAVQASLLLDKSVLLYVGGDAPVMPDAPIFGDATIDVWWFDTVDNGVLPLMLCHLITRHVDFSNVKVRIFSPYWRASSDLHQVTTVAEAASRISVEESSLSAPERSRRSTSFESSCSSSGSKPDVVRPRELTAEEHREHMLEFLQMSRIAVDDVMFVPCEQHLDINSAMRDAVANQAPASRTSLIIADVPYEATCSKSAREWGSRIARLANGLPPMLLVQGHASNAEEVHHVGAAVGSHLGHKFDFSTEQLPAYPRTNSGPAALI